MEVIVDYHYDGKREVLYEKKGENMQDLIKLLHETKEIADKHFTAILNEGEDVKGDPTKKAKTSENDLEGLEGNEDNDDGDNDNNQDNKIDEEIN